MATQLAVHIGRYASDRPVLACFDTARTAYEVGSFRFVPRPEDVLVVSSEEYVRMLEISSDPREATASLRALYDTYGA